MEVDEPASIGGKVLVKSYGCQMNVYDATRMADLLSRAGYAATADEAEADLVILNTCHIREKAAEKIYSELGKLAREKRARESAGREMTDRRRRLRRAGRGRGSAQAPAAVDLVVGPQSYHRLPDLLNSARGGRRV